MNNSPIEKLIQDIIENAKDICHCYETYIDIINYCKSCGKEFKPELYAAKTLAVAFQEVLIELDKECRCFPDSTPCGACKFVARLNKMVKL